MDDRDANHDHERYWLSHVPAFPEGGNTEEQLRWCVAVMDGARDLGFAASLLSHEIDRGGLTARQAKFAGGLIARVKAEWQAGALPFQQTPRPPRVDLSLLHAEGTA